MLLPADALKIECKFVERMKTFLTRRKSLVDVCYCEVLPYFSDAALVDLLEDCLDHPTECALQKKADTYPDNLEEDTPVSTPCEDQLAITLQSLATICSYEAKPYNSLNGGSFPSMVITDDSERVNATIDVLLQNYCNDSNQTETVLGGCTSSGCSTSNQARVGRGTTTTATHLNSLSYITKLRVYEADPFGAITPGAIDLDLNPATSVYYSASGSCPGCSAVNSTDVRIGNSNFVSAFNTLMDNVSLARYGETGRHKMFASNNTTTLVTTIGSYFWHNPADYIFGINKNNPSISIYNPTTSKTSIFNTINFTVFEGIRFYKDDILFSTSCGDLEPLIANQTIFPPVLTAKSNFNLIEFISPFSSYPITVTSDSTISCTYYTLTATYNTTNVASVLWKNSSDEILSTSSTVVVTDADTYTFQATLDNGCVVSDTITLT